MVKSSVLILLSPLVSCFAWAADGPGHGHAWFIYKETQPFNWCVRAADKDRTQNAQYYTYQAMDSWRYVSGFMGYAAFTGGYVSRPKLRDCQGDEDLTIYYGVENEKIQKDRAAFSNPVGFAQLESYDEQEGWGRGYIWVSGGLEGDALYAILLHELGHVCGHDHVAGTIMDENIAEQLPAITAQLKHASHGAPGAYEWINVSRDLLEEDQVNLAPLTAEPAPGSELEEAVKILTGKKLEGPLTLKFFESTAWMAGKPVGPRHGRFDIFGPSCARNWLWQKTGCDYEFKLSFDDRSDLKVGDAMLFRRKYRGKETGMPLTSSLQTGTIIRKDGKTFDFLISRDLGQRVEVFLLQDGRRLKLF